jgi:hypothetical protein
MEHRFTRQELFDLVWSKPMSHLVAELKDDGDSSHHVAAPLR